MRYENFEKNELYYLRAESSSPKLFGEEIDYYRFIFLITHLQSPIRIHNISWYASTFLKNGKFSIKPDKIEDIIQKRDVNLVAFCLTPNDFHIIVRGLKDRVISVYMQRIMTAYGKYFNSKYSKRGHVFKSQFRALKIKEGEGLLSASANIHIIPKTELKNEPREYPYASFTDYVGPNRWGELLLTEQVLKHFKKQTDYMDFVQEYSNPAFLVPN